MSSTSSVPGSAERVDVRVSAAVRTDDGVSFGTLRQVSGDTLLIEVDATLAIGHPVEVRVDLSPTPGTALIRARCVRQLVTAPGETPRFAVKAVDMPTEDRSRWLSWLRAIKTGGTLSDFGVLSTASEPLAGAGAQARTSEVRATLELMNARRGGQGSVATPVPHSDPFGHRSDVREGTAGREAMRNALRRALASTPPVTAGPQPAARPAPPPPAAPPPTPAARPPAAPPPTPAARPSAAPTPTPVEDPTYSTSTTAGRTFLEVRWTSGDQFGYDIHSQLVRGYLNLTATGDPLPDKGSVVLVIRHGTLFIQTKAVVVEGGPFGVTFRLELSPADIETLRHASRPLSTVSTSRSTAPKR